jgi:hypothetical protein
MFLFKPRTKFMLQFCKKTVLFAFRTNNSLVVVVEFSKEICALLVRSINIGSCTFT